MSNITSLNDMQGVSIGDGVDASGNDRGSRTSGTGQRSASYIEVSGVSESSTSTDTYGVAAAGGGGSAAAATVSEKTKLLGTAATSSFGSSSELESGHYHHRSGGGGGGSSSSSAYGVLGGSFGSRMRRGTLRVLSALWNGKAKIIILTCFLVLAAIAFGMYEEAEEEGHLHSLAEGADLVLPAPLNWGLAEVRMELGEAPPGGQYMVTTVLRDSDGAAVGDSWVVTVVGDEPPSHLEHRFEIPASYADAPGDLDLVFATDSATAVGAQILVLGVSRYAEYEVIFAALILGFVYVLIVFELIHRALAAMLGAFLALGVLSMLNLQPSLEKVVGWIDYETVMLLFGMMIIVGILAETGVFEWSAVKAYKYSGGNVWRLMYILCFFSAVVSAFLDNVTTILLLTPVTIRMCAVIGLDPVPILLAEVLFSNIGGTATAVGDPPNVILVSTDWTEVVGQSDIEFAEFTGHMALGILFVCSFSFVFLKFLYRGVDLDSKDPPAVAEIKREIFLWQRTRGRIYGNTPEEEVVNSLLENKISALQTLLREQEGSATAAWERSVVELEEKNPIKDKDLLLNSSVVLFGVIILFFIHSVPEIHLNLGWIAIIGAMVLLVVAGVKDLDHVLERIEWGTLMFFAALFVLMDALAELGLIDWIGEQTAALISSVDEDARLATALILVLWVSAIASAFIDNIPFTTAMIPVIKNIANDPNVGVPLRPLVWALAFGTCLGGNGTLIGASANVVAAGMAEQEGITISFNRFFRVGFPMMLFSVVIATIYLVICHVAIGWDVPT